jgi:hypothetical protein
MIKRNRRLFRPMERLWPEDEHQPAAHALVDRQWNRPLADFHGCAHFGSSRVSSKSGAAQAPWFGQAWA